MTLILETQRDADCAGAFLHYWNYLETHKDDFSESVYAIAASKWWYDFEDRRCPHDASLREARFIEATDPDGNRDVSFIIDLDSPWRNDNSILRIKYRGVMGYTFQMPTECLHNGHSGWRYDEFRIKPPKMATHEIEWADGATWVIDFRDLEYTTLSNRDQA